MTEWEDPSSNPDIMSNIAVLNVRMRKAELEHEKLESDLKLSLAGIYKKLDRPSWVVLWIIGSLMTISGSMFTLILSQGLR